MSNPLIEVLSEVQARIAEYRGEKLSEEDTRAALIDPVLCVLGWDARNLREVKRGYRGKRGSTTPLTMRFFSKGMKIPSYLSRPSALGKSLERSANQIMGYAGTFGAEWVVLTNGDEYRLYNTGAARPFPQRLFSVPLRISSPESSMNNIAETVALLAKQDIGKLDEAWRSELVDRDLRGAEASASVMSDGPGNGSERTLQEGVQMASMANPLPSEDQTQPKSRILWLCSRKPVWTLAIGTTVKPRGAESKILL